MSTAADLVRLVFEHALEYAAGRMRREVPAYVTRGDLEQALITLRFADMELTLEQADSARAQHEQALAELRARIEADRTSGNVPDVTIVEPTGDEPTTQPFGKLRLSDDE